jgi:hypothetical protein
LFDESETESEEETTKKGFSKEDEEFQGEDASEPDKPEPVKKPPPLDFAAELSRKLAAKNKPPQSEKIPETVQEQVITKPSAVAAPPTATRKPAANLFDDESGEENDDLFAAPVSQLVSKRPSAAQDKPRKSLFDDSGDEETKPVRTSAPIAATLPNPTPTQAAKTSKLALFDNNSEEEEDFFKKPTNNKNNPPAAGLPSAPLPKVNSSLFDDDDDLFTPVQASAAPSQASRKKVALFSDSSDTERDELVFSASKKTLISESTVVEEKKAPAKVDGPRSVFDDSTDDADDLFAVAKKSEQTKAEETKPR